MSLPRLRTLVVLAALAFGGCSEPALLFSHSSLGEPFGPPFEDARALAFDAQGTLYVVDAGTSTVAQFVGEDRVMVVLGGPGTGDYAFLNPSGIDPTNGLTLFVADTGNGRIQRFSGDGRLLDTIPVPTARGDRDASKLPGLTDALGNDRRAGTGRPTAVASVVSGELYAIEETEGVVLRWDERYDFDRVVGGRDAGDGALKDPVALALGPERRLFVADRGHAAVLVYNVFGEYVRRIGDGQLAGITSVTTEPTLDGEELVVVLSDALRYYALDGRLLRIVELTESDELVGIAKHGRETYYLTRRGLTRNVFRPRPR